MKIKVKLYDSPRVVVKSPGFYACGEYISSKRIKRSKYLSKKDKELLLDMCYGVEVKRIKKIKKYNAKKLIVDRPIAKYFVNGTIFRGGDIEEVISFKRV